VFLWSDAAQAAFDSLKQAFGSAPVLSHPDNPRPFLVETDASDYANGAILSQYDDFSVLHRGLGTVAFYSRQL
jgi:hypothetical protein